MRGLTSFNDIRITIESVYKFAICTMFANNGAILVNKLRFARDLEIFKIIIGVNHKLHSL